MKQAPNTTKGLELNGTKVNPDDADFQQSYIGTRRALADAAGTLTADDELIAITAMTAARAFTLGAASLYPGRKFVFKDESGAVTSTFKLTAVGVVDGATNPDLVAAAYAVKRIYSNGTAWFSL